MPTIKSLLCPVDFSEMSKGRARLRRLPLAQSHPGRAQAGPTWWTSCTVSTATRSLHDRHRGSPRDGASGKSQLKELVASPIPAKFEVRFGRAADGSSSQAKEDKVDLLVMGSHGRSGIQPSAGGQRGGIGGAPRPARCWWCANNPLPFDPTHLLAICSAFQPWA